MKALLLLICAFLAACSTTVYGPNGKPQFRTYGDLGDTTFTGPGTALHSAKMNHSVPTRAGGGIVANVGSDIVAAVVPGSGVVPTVGRAAVATLPHFKPTPTTP